MKTQTAQWKRQGGTLRGPKRNVTIDSACVLLAEVGVRRCPRLTHQRRTRRALAVALSFVLAASSLLGRAHAAASDLDLTFDGDGKVTTDFFGGLASAKALAIQGDGRIVAAGFASAGGDQDFALARYNRDGSLDPTFDGDGKLTTDFSGSSNDDVASAVAVQADGKIVVAGDSDSPVLPQFAVARYNDDGSLDPTFDGDGKVTTVGLFSSSTFNDIAIQADGKIVAAGRVRLLGENAIRFALARYNSDGSLDITFDGDGFVTTAILAGLGTASANAINVQADGKIVVAGTADATDTSPLLALARYYSDGSLDSTFDGDGIVTTAISCPIGSTVDVVIQADGKIVAAGTSLVSVDPVVGTDTDFVLARYNSDGSLDPTFDGDGIATNDLSGPNIIELALSLALQNNGKIVAAGFNLAAASDFLLARYNGDGSLDTSFDGDGKLATDVSGSGDPDGAVAIAIQGDGKIVAAGFSEDAAGRNFALARYQGDSGAAPPCPKEQGFWKDNPDAWPTNSLTLGSQSYTKTELLTILHTPNRGDASLMLAKQLIAAKLNTANGSDPAPINSRIADADTLLNPFGGELPYAIKTSSATGQAMISDANALESYNRGESTPGCAP